MPKIVEVFLLTGTSVAFRPRNWLDRVVRQRAVQSWARLRRQVAAIRPARLRDLRADAGNLRGELDEFLRLSAPRVLASRAELAALPLPAGTDWRWRPEILNGTVRQSGLVAPDSGTLLTDGTAVWHDCTDRALIVRQIRNVDVTDLAAFGLRVEAFGFTGSFLSLAIDLPPEVLDGLTLNHIIRLEVVLQSERAQDIYARLNINNGPNTEEALRHLGEVKPGHPHARVVEFDLALTQMNEMRLDKVWLDLIFEKPVMNAAMIREMIFSRHLRANV